MAVDFFLAASALRAQSSSERHTAVRMLKVGVSIARLDVTKTFNGLERDFQRLQTQSSA